jgi:hypothetical protein
VSIIKPPRIQAGMIVVELPCPRCGVLEAITVMVSGVLTTSTADPPMLRVKSTAKPIEHYCHPHGAPAPLFSESAEPATDLFSESAEPATDTPPPF